MTGAEGVRKSRIWVMANVPTMAAMTPMMAAPLLEYQPAMMVAIDAATQPPSAKLTAGTHRRRLCSLERESAMTARANATRPAPMMRTQPECAGVEPVVDTLASDQCGQTCES